MTAPATAPARSPVPSTPSRSRRRNPTAGHTLGTPLGRWPPSPIRGRSGSRAARAASPSRRSAGAATPPPRPALSAWAQPHATPPGGRHEPAPALVAHVVLDRRDRVIARLEADL